MPIIVDDVTDAVVPLLRETLTRAEQAELHQCLDRVSLLHGGPTKAQPASSSEQCDASARRSDDPQRPR